MFGISGFELMIIAAFALVVFGPDKIPDIARTAGRMIRQFKRAQAEMEAMVRAEMYTGKKPDVAKVSSPNAQTAVIPEGDDDEEEEEE